MTPKKEIKLLALATVWCVAILATIIFVTSLTNEYPKEYIFVIFSLILFFSIYSVIRTKYAEDEIKRLEQMADDIDKFNIV